jgi:hypothetical protein
LRFSGVRKQNGNEMTSLISACTIAPNADLNPAALQGLKLEDPVGALQLAVAEFSGGVSVRNREDEPYDSLFGD